MEPLCEDLGCTHWCIIIRIHVRDLQIGFDSVDAGAVRL